jgi:putative ABC transport system substrate-binding protein
VGYVKPLRRRVFVQHLGGLGISAAGLALLDSCGSLPGQPPPKVPVIGFLHSIAPPRAGTGQGFDAFSQGLREQGLVEGQNLRIEWRFAEGQNERLPVLATELIGLGVRLIVAGGATAPSVVRQVTDRVPIVLYMSARDPVAQGFAVSLARPGGNVTGTVRFGTAASVKAVELLRALVPTARRLVHMTNFTAPGEDLTRDGLAATTERLGLQFLAVDVQSEGQMEPAFEKAQAWGADMVNVVNIVPLNMPRDLVPALAARARLPGSCGAREWVEAGLLMSYGSNDLVLARRTAWYVARILNGADPAELPMERPTVFELLVNRATLANLGLSMPPDVAAQVTEWVE